MVDRNAFLKETAERTKGAFERQKRILSFQQWLDTFLDDPVRMGRNAAQYLLDVFNHFGRYEVDGIGGKCQRFRLFDGDFDEIREKLAGHERVQQDVHDLLQRFAATGRTNRLILIHGPNGSGKSTFLDLLVRALEHYSTLDEGALFTFNWIFTERIEGRGQLGFGADERALPKDTLAFMDENRIACKLVCELRENPVFLIPRAEREKLLDELIAQRPDDARRAERLRGPYLREGALSAKSKAVFDALLNAYRGDWLKVMRHVQVERFFISKRFRAGAAVVEPQQSVDASARPLSFEQRAPLPPILQGLQLVELSGELVQASGGLVEFSDLFKRPLELNKYLLNTCERGTVALGNTNTYLNTVFFGTCNEKYLSAFKANPDWTSFKARIELVRMGYLLEWPKEREIYRSFLDEIRGGRHVAPHTLDVAALWAVMTRLRRSDPPQDKGELGRILRALPPLDKARLYGEGEVSSALNSEEKRLLKAAVPWLRDEYRDAVAEFENFGCAAYEGRRGASAREMKALLAEAADDPNRECLSALALLRAMKRLLQDRSVYDFLRLKTDGPYHDTEGFIEAVEQVFLEWAAAEIYDSMELVEAKEYERRVEEYFRHVRAYVSGEKIENPRSGKLEDPSQEVLEGLEDLMDLKEKPEIFRGNLMSKIAAFSLEHPKEKIVYSEIFPELILNLRDSYYREKQAELSTLARYILVAGTEDDSLVPESQRPRIESTLSNMRKNYGYCDACAKETLSFLLRSLERS